MPATTPLQGLTIPELSDIANLPAQVSSLVQEIEKRLVMRFSSESNRNAAITSPEEGETCFITGLKKYTTYSGGAWRKWSPDAPYALIGYRATPSISTASLVAVTFNTEVIDTHGMFTSPSTDIKCVKEGYHRIVYKAIWSGGTTTGGVESRVLINGSEVEMGTDDAITVSGKRTSNSVSIKPYLYVNDVVSVSIIQDTGAAKTFSLSTVAGCNISVEYVGG
jgi:hypothetical protein